MRADANDLNRHFKENGNGFEEFVHELIRTASRSCGLSQNDIDWDSRPSVRDGGRDIVIRAGNPLGPGHFIPDRQSLWSIKSGADGVDPKKLEKEILPQKRKDHPKVREALQNNHAFVWCALHAATHDKRDKMRETANSIAQQLKVSPTLIEFRWQDRIVQEVNQLPNVIAIYMDDVADRWVGVRTLSEWQREPGLNTPWREFGSRTALVSLIANHLLARGSPNVLHIAGLSGIGKTRTVLEACSCRPELRGVFYLINSADLTPTLERTLRETQHVLVVIDETRLEEIDTVVARFADCADRVRIVTIGPASRQRATARRDIIVVPEPESEDDILAVISPHAGGLSDVVLHSIAKHAAHDLRLALMLVRATLSEPRLQVLPIVDFHDVWSRIMRLFRTEISNQNEYQRRYEALTVAIDVGVESDLRQELQTLGNFFGQSELELLDCSNVAVDCGLGLRAGRFFEATPHALAIGLFHSLFRRQLRDRLSELMGSLSPRLLRRFLERCQECPDEVREEVAAHVGSVFLEWLRRGDLTQLALRESSRIFQAWAEFDPGRGLEWLRREVEAAPEEQLLALDGEPDGSGGWRGRRQLVWLCQNLACFREYFFNCEAILFRFAQHETEQIGNNSIAVWKSFFWPALAHTEVEFNDRFPILLDRLRQVNSDDLQLVLNAAFQGLSPNLFGLPIPPRVVGGRIVPKPWMPETNNQLQDLRRAAADAVLTVITQLPSKVRGQALREVIRQLRLFRYLELIDRVRGIFATSELTHELRLALVLELNHEVDFYRMLERDERQPIPAQIQALIPWLEELSPQDLATRVQDLTARVAYDAWGEEGPDLYFAGIAEELITNPEVFESLAEWFDSPQAKAIEYLGFSVGKRDTSDRLAEYLHKWLQADRCKSVTVSYLNGAANRASGLPIRWITELDYLEQIQPERAIIATFVADVTSRGFERIFRAFDLIPHPDSSLLQGFGRGAWPNSLTIEQQLKILETLQRLAEAGDTLAATIGVNIIRFRGHRKTPPLDDRLIPCAFELVTLAPTSDQSQSSYNWRELLRFLCPHNPVRVASILVDLITSPVHHPWRFDQENTESLIEAARINSDGVMDVIGRAILDRDRRAMFGVTVYRGLFEAIGVKSVSRWVTEHGPKYLRWLARHFSSPSLDPTGQVVIPPLTLWLFTERESDQDAFEWFLAGRHYGARMWSGSEALQKRMEMDPYVRHPLRRVREWAQYEISFVEGEDKRFHQYEDESERL